MLSVKEKLEAISRAMDSGCNFPELADANFAYIKAIVNLDDPPPAPPKPALTGYTDQEVSLALRELHKAQLIKKIREFVAEGRFPIEMVSQDNGALGLKPRVGLADAKALAEALLPLIALDLRDNLIQARNGEFLPF